MPQKVTISGKTKTINDFETFYYHGKKPNQGRHGFQADQVVLLFPEISADYLQLKDICETARYINYKYDRQTSNLAFDRLQRIKKYCGN